MALKKLSLSSPITPDYSITALGKKKEDKFNVFGEKGDADFGDYYDFEIINSLGATQKQLNDVKKSGGTQNFQYIKKHK
jgi:hypothetical protein